MSKTTGLNLLTNNLTYVISFIFGCGLLMGKIYNIIDNQDSMQQSILKLESSDIKFQDDLDNLNLQCGYFRK